MASLAAAPEPTTSPRPIATPSPSPAFTIELRGEVVETGCFIIGGRRGQAHRQCAIACAHAGESLGVLDETSGLLYFSVLDHRDDEASDPLLPHIAEIVEVRGLPVEFGDLPGLVVTSVRSLGPAD